ncbi:xanthine dehydrogenase family protein molybdopterin-binding subunit [Pusillimonas noertemannii]|uniref:xanthine dehydrogenase family protein molybdopterin-binding subunit n=1 Tax=Pusillimonas noertemannii TaxID=305977 RepID=UPI00333FAE5D
MTTHQSNDFVGQRFPRREDQYLLRGEGLYLDDLAEPHNTLHLAFVLSPHAHARILSIDVSEALEVPGVVAVLTGEDFVSLIKPIRPNIEMPTYLYTDRLALALDVVRFVGEQVAVVLAESKYAAHDAIELVQVEYELMPAVVSLEQAISEGSPVVHEHVAGNIAFRGEFASDDFATKHAAGKYRLRERFRHGRVSGSAMEPRGCMAVPIRGEEITFYTSTQIPHIVRTEIAKHVIGCSESALRVVVPEVGGGFGVKAQLYTEELISVALCLKYRRPIKWVQDRREDLLTNTHARDHIYEMEATFDERGVLTSLELELYTNIGAYSSSPFGGTIETTGGARQIVGPYKLPNYAYRCYAVTTNTCASGVYRGVAQPACFMAMEGIMDRIARQLNIDPLEVRLRNIVLPGDMPWVNVLGVRYDTGSYQKCLELARERSGYEDFRRRFPGSRLKDGKYHGIGIGNMVELTGTGAPGWRVRGLQAVSGIDGATIRVEPTGKVSVFVSQANAGQGHFTTFAQIAADHIGVRPEAVTVYEGDTASTPFGTGTFASRSAITGGGAVIQAAEKVSNKIRRLAAHELQVEPNDIVLQDGRARVASDPSRFVDFEKLCLLAYSLGKGALPPTEVYGLEATEYYDPPVVTVANAVHIIEVAIDAIDGRVAIENYYVVHDCGKVINPMIVDGQIHGGIAQGVGEVLMEEIVYDEHGQLINASLLDYLLPTALDVPDLSTLTIDHVETPSIDSLGGFKGVGEGGIIGSVAALTSAIYDALEGIGANVNSVPLRPSHIASLIRAARQSAPDPEATRAKQELTAAH